MTEWPPRMQTVRSAATAALAAAGLIVLVGILILLVHFAQVGLTVNVRGDVSLGGEPTGVTGEVRLVMEDAVTMVTTGPDAGPVPVALSPTDCPQCGGPLLPIRWQPLSGEIEWQCAECDLTVGAP
ncbi:MAG: hypothetical protein JSW65_02815 [Candidatus Bipolaricaulota bacterium]|nr:MAG: hypothetical protein JSW65_02815 [Candidatus Bipolaricaulota bacterium]